MIFYYERVLNWVYKILKTHYLRATNNDDWKTPNANDMHSEHLLVQMILNVTEEHQLYVSTISVCLLCFFLFLLPHTAALSVIPPFRGCAAIYRRSKFAERLLTQTNTPPDRAFVVLHVDNSNLLLFIQFQWLNGEWLDIFNTYIGRYCALSDNNERRIFSYFQYTVKCVIKKSKEKK